MLDSTIELIIFAASNSWAVFCLCNLIIAAIVLIGSLKTSSHSGEARNHAFPIVVGDVASFKKNAAYSCDELIGKKEEKISSVSIDMVTGNEEENGSDEDDDELRKRAEEFIEKINRGWRAEKIKIYSSLGQ